MSCALEHLEAAVGSTVTLDEVLLVGDDAGTRSASPRVESAAVLGTVVEDGRDKKIRVFKYKKRKHYRRTKGHRQSFIGGADRHGLGLSPDTPVRRPRSG